MSLPRVTPLAPIDVAFLRGALSPALGALRIDPDDPDDLVHAVVTAVDDRIAAARARALAAPGGAAVVAAADDDVHLDAATLYRLTPPRPA